MIPIWIVVIIAILAFNLGFIVHGFFTIGRDGPSMEDEIDNAIHQHIKDMEVGNE